MTRPGYKKTEIGEIPEEWELTNIKSSSFLKGRIGWQGLTTKEYLFDGEYFLVTGTEFENGKIKWDKCNFVSKDRFEQDPNIILRDQDILVTKDGTIGKVAYVDSLQKPATLNSGVFVLRPLNGSYFPHYLFYVLRSNYFTEFVNNISAGSTISHLYQHSFNDFSFPLPPFSEQRKIAEILTTADRKIELIDTEIKAAERLKKGLMQRLLTRGIGHEKFKMIEVGEIPEEWSVIPISETGQYINGMAFKPSDWKEHGIPIVRIENLNDTRAHFNYFQGKVDEKYILKNEDILLSWSASLGVYLWDKGNAVLNQHIFKVIPGKSIDRYYLYWSLHRSIDNLNKVTHGSTMKHFQRGELEKSMVALPPLQEQQKIAEILSTVDQKLELMREKRTEAENLKKGLMQILLTGQVRVKLDHLKGDA